MAEQPPKIHILLIGIDYYKQVLEVQLLTEDKQPFPDPQNLTVKNDEVICLRLSNKGTQPLKVAVLDIEPTWEVSQIAIGGMASPFFALEPGADENILLRLRVPDDAAYEIVRKFPKTPLIPLKEIRSSSRISHKQISELLEV